jgi:Multicopper oxidase
VLPTRHDASLDGPCSDSEACRFYLKPGARVSRSRRAPVQGSLANGDDANGMCGLSHSDTPFLYDSVEKSGGPVPTDIKEYVNDTTRNGLESPSIAHDFPSDGISELPRVGSIEMWEVVHLSTVPMASHPVHLHLSQFQVLNRQAIDITLLAARSAAYAESLGRRFSEEGSCIAGRTRHLPQRRLSAGEEPHIPPQVLNQNLCRRPIRNPICLSVDDAVKPLMLATAACPSESRPVAR